MTLYYGLIFVLILEYLRPASYIPPLEALRLNTLVPLIVVATTMIRKSPISLKELADDTNVRLIFFLIGLVALSIVTADLQRTAFDVFTAVFGYGLLALIIFRQVTDLSRIKGVFKTLVLVHVAVALLTPEMFTDASTRHYLAAGLFGDGNDFALSVNVAIPLCLFLLFDSKKVVTRAAYAVMLIFLIFCVVATRSRGGTVALVVLAAYYWMRSNRKFLTALACLGALGLVLLLAPPAYFERMTTIADTQEGSAQGRLLAWGAGIRMAVDNPILGVGAGHFPVAYGVLYRPKGIGANEIPWQTAHSIYFLILGELGLPGIGMLLTFLVWNIRQNSRLTTQIRKDGDPSADTHDHLLTSLSAAVLAFASGGAFLSAVYYPHIFLLSGLLSAARRTIGKRPKDALAKLPQPMLPISRHAWAQRQRVGSSVIR